MITDFKIFEVKQIPIIPNKFVYHTSNPKFRKSILKKGLIPTKGEQRIDDDPYGEAIFVTNSDKKKDWFDSTYDDDIYRINTENLSDVKWYKDRNMGLNKNNLYLVTFDKIPVESIELIYEGTGKDLL
jgi:hypothetical protein